MLTVSIQQKTISEMNMKFENMEIKICLKWTLNSKSKESAHASIKNSKDTKKLFCYLVSLAFDELSYHNKKSRQCSIILQQRREKGWQIPAPQLFVWAKIFIHALTVTFPQTIKVFEAVTYIKVFVVWKISGIATIKVFHVANNCGVGFATPFAGL